MMNARKTRLGSGGARTAKAVILYDRLETMLLANQLLGRLPRGTGGAADWAVQSWRFEMLDKGREGERALAETDDAEVMVVAIGREDHLRDWPASWLARWLACRKSVSATILVVLVGLTGPVGAEWSVVAPLRLLAEAGHFGMVVCEESGMGDGQQQSGGLHDVWLLEETVGPASPSGEAWGRWGRSFERFPEVGQQMPERGSAAG